MTEHFLCGRASMARGGWEVRRRSALLLLPLLACVLCAGCLNAGPEVQSAEASAGAASGGPAETSKESMSGAGGMPEATTTGASRIEGGRSEERRVGKECRSR